MRELRVVLAPLDGTRRALRALPVAQALARMRDASLHVLHVAPEGGLPRDVPAAIGLDAAPSSELVVDSAEGDPAEAIARAADRWRDAVVVLCSRTGVLAEHGVLGPVSKLVLSRTDRPVMIVPATRPEAPWTLRTMLVPHDGSQATTSALAPAFELAQASGARLCVLHVAAQPGAQQDPRALTTPRYVDQRQHEWPVWTREFLQRLSSAQPGFPRSARLSVGRGEPASVIARLAAEHAADLVVMCSHGSLEAGRAAVLQSVLRDARDPVLVLRCGP